MNGFFFFFFFSCISPVPKRRATDDHSFHGFVTPEMASCKGSISPHIAASSSAMRAQNTQGGCFFCSTCAPSCNKVSSVS
mmetsp:Transcript_344/g.220  ORF Transcript_344/g.220 Transcript_344/m.220 type:complete len:80 (+) Transcript_344:28-267(+)